MVIRFLVSTAQTCGELFINFHKEGVRPSCVVLPCVMRCHCRLLTQLPQYRWLSNGWRERNNCLHFYQKIVVRTFLDPSLSCNGWQTARGWNVFVFPELHSVHIAACFLRSSNSFEAHPVFSQLQKFIHFNCSWILNCFLSSRKYNYNCNAGRTLLIWNWTLVMKTRFAITSKMFSLKCFSFHYKSTLGSSQHFRAHSPD